ncbi:MAG: hypothetical protein HY320_01625 [Armatimonadetes bacterium]|nr:hypothetical protein [Armatimonadota bacterium]
MVWSSLIAGATVVGSVLVSPSMAAPRPERSLVGVVLGRPFSEVLRRYGNPSQTLTVSLTTGGQGPQASSFPGGPAGGPGFGLPGGIGGAGGGLGMGEAAGFGSLGFGAGTPFGGAPFGGATAGQNRPAGAPFGGAGGGGTTGRASDAEMYARMMSGGGIGPMGSGGTPSNPPGGFPMMAAGGPGTGGGPDADMYARFMSGGGIGPMGSGGAMPGAGGGFPTLPPVGPGMGSVPFGGFGGAGQRGGAGLFGGQPQENMPAVSSALLWRYNKAGDVRLEFLVNEDGRVAQISVAAPPGKAFPQARTSKGVSLGSSYMQVLNAYGFPEQTKMLAGGRYQEAWYSKDYRVAFTLENIAGSQRVVRITIALQD